MSHYTTYKLILNAAKAAYDEQYAHPEIPMPDAGGHICDYCGEPATSLRLDNTSHVGKLPKEKYVCGSALCLKLSKPLTKAKTEQATHQPAASPQSLF